jgi:hypothetical protein
MREPLMCKGKVADKGGDGTRSARWCRGRTRGEPGPGRLRADDSEPRASLPHLARTLKDGHRGLAYALDVVDRRSGLLHRYPCCRPALPRA